MSRVSGDAALDVLIGLFFVFFILSIVCYALKEAGSRDLTFMGAF